jgi:glycosyltransferase involved in cell wall biosynthesis
MSKPDVSIIIRTLNEERYLPELLSSIQHQRINLQA